MFWLLQLLRACLFLKAPREDTASKRWDDKALLSAGSSVELISQVSDLRGVYLTLLPLRTAPLAELIVSLVLLQRFVLILF